MVTLNSVINTPKWGAGVPGSARAWKWMVVVVRGDWTLIGAPPFCPRNQFIFVSVPCALAWIKDGGWLKRGQHRGIPYGPQPSSLYFSSSSSSEWSIRTAMSAATEWMNEWPGRRLYVWASLLICCSGRVTFWEWGLLLLSIHGGENWSMRVPDLGFLMCGERAAQMACADRMFWVPLLAGLSHPASACVPVQLAQPNVELQRLRVPNNRPYFALACCCCHALRKPIIKMNVLSKCCIASATVYQCLDCAGNQVKWGEYLSCGCEDVRLIAKANRSM